VVNAADTRVILVVCFLGKTQTRIHNAKVYN
jgi:hypothetical protein